MYGIAKMKTNKQNPTANYNRSFWSSVSLNKFSEIQIFMVNRTL